jgi:hypothetical protein
MNRILYFFRTGANNTQQRNQPGGEKTRGAVRYPDRCAYSNFVGDSDSHFISIPRKEDTEVNNNNTQEVS